LCSEAGDVAAITNDEEERNEVGFIRLDTFETRCRSDIMTTKKLLAMLLGRKSWRVEVPYI
jgi:hypothetical protein